MGTKDFNFIDKLIANLRLRQVKSFVSNDDLVLDFGCGAQSYLLNSVRGKIKQGYGLDYDIEESEDGKLIYKKFRFQDKFPFDNKTFDKIFMLAVLEHIPLDNVDILFKELRNILKSDGKLVMTTPTPKAKPVLEFLSLKLHLINKGEILDHKHYYNQGDVVELAKRTGFQLEKYSTFQFGMNSLIVFS